MARIVVPGSPHHVTRRGNRCQRTLFRRDDVLVKAKPLLKPVPRWAKHLSADADQETIRQLHLHEATGRPVGSDRFLARMERIVGRLPRPRRPGRKKKTRDK